MKSKELFPGFVVKDGGSDRNLDRDAFAVVPGLIAAFSMPTALRSVFGVKPEMQERVAMNGRHHGDIAAAPAIAAARAAARDVLLPAEGQAAVAAIAGLYRNSRLVYKHQ